MILEMTQLELKFNKSNDEEFAHLQAKSLNITKYIYIDAWGLTG